ncbi:MAG: thioredoxin family protein [Thiohalomonadaceae bacterium]
MKRLLVLLVLALALSPAAFAATGKDPYAHFFNDTFGDFAEELEQAQAKGKKGVLVFFEMDECPFCHYMKKNVLNQPEVQKYYRDNFMLFSVDIEGDVEMVDFAGKTTTQKNFAEVNRVRATPVIAFFDLEGNPVHRYTGRTSGTDEFLLMGRYVADGAYRHMPFSRYKREQKK